MQAVQASHTPINSIQQLPAHAPKTVVRRAYNVYLTAKKCSYVWQAYRLANPGYLASATVQAFAVPIAESTGSETATKCAVLAAETLNLALNPISWTIGKACHWLGNQAAEMIQDGLKIQNPELQDLVEVLAHECANYSTLYTAKGIATNKIPINLSNDQVRRLRIERETPEIGLFNGHKSTRLDTSTNHNPSGSGRVLNRTRISSVDLNKIAGIAHCIKNTPKLSFCENLVRLGVKASMASLLVSGTALLLLAPPAAFGAIAPLAIFSSGLTSVLMTAASLGCFGLIVALDFLDELALKHKEATKNRNALQLLQNKEELQALTREMGAWNKNLDALLPSFLL